MPPDAATINEVITRLEFIINHCKNTRSRLGYFAMLYCNVTRRVKQGILKNEFADNAFMEKMDVLFANHYIKAWHQWTGGKTPAQSWATAFNAANDDALIVLQHYLLGMNAHINLDLGIATVEALEGRTLDSIRNDFNTINRLLGSMIEATKTCLEKINPLMYLLRLHKGNMDDMVVGFSISKAREGAWCFAENLVTQTGAAYHNCISERDHIIAQLGINIAASQSGLLKGSLKMIKRFENNDVLRNIDNLQIK